MAGHAYAFGRFTLEPRRQLLDGGRPVDLGGKALDLLSALAEASGKLVTKDELMAAVWPGLVVEENAIQVHVSALRKALGSEAERLVTVRGRGYRLVLDAPPITAGNATSASAPGSIAILPFDNLTGDPAKGYLADGMAEELIATLSRTSGLKVPARTSTFAYKGRAADVRSIARELGVAAVLEGSVREAGERIRVTAQLIDAESGFHLWSENFDREVDDLLALQDELAGAIARVLQARLGADGPRTSDPEAYRLYLQARAMASQVNPRSLLRAVELHEAAIARDPGLARAWAGLAGTLLVATLVGALPPDRRADARAKAEQAIRIDPGLAGAYAIRAALDAGSGRWLDAESGFRSAIERNRDEPAALEAAALNVAGPCGQLHRASQSVQRAFALAPANANFCLSCAILAWLSGNGDATADFLETAKLLGAPDDRGTVRVLRSEIARTTGRFDEAAELMAAALTTVPALRAAGADRVAATVYAALAGRAGHPAATDAVAELVAATDADDALWRHLSAIGHLLRWQVMLDNVDAAYELAERLLAAWRRSGHLAMGALLWLWRPEMRPFREDARFQSFVDRLGMMPFWEGHGPPDGYALQGGRLVVG